MTRTDDYDDDDILRDGESIRVPLFLADSLQRAVATRYQVADAYALHKPGYRNVQTLSDAKTLFGPRVWGRTPESRRQHKREETAAAEDARAAAYEGRNQYLKDAYRQPFRDAAEMQAGFHPMIALEYQRRDLRGPEKETGAGGDSEKERAAMKARASNAWRTYDPHHPPALASSSPHERFDPAPGAGAYNESKVTEAFSPRKIAEAAARREKVVGVSREDYIRRTRTAWDPTAATGIEAQREKWLGK